MKSPFIIAVFLSVMPIMLSAQDGKRSNTTEKKITSSFTAEKIIIDGQLTEQIWEKSPSTANFTQIEPLPGKPAFFKTIVKSVYNSNSLYFGIISYDSAGRNRLKAPDLKRDFDFHNHDLVGITIDGFNDGRNSMTFFVNPYGAQRDYLSFDDTYFDVDWNGLWKVKTSRTDEYWIAEFEIPWKTIRYKEAKNGATTFGLNFQRVSRNTNERSAWSAYPRSVGFNRMEYAGILTDFSPPKPTTNIQLNPYAIFSNYSHTSPDIKAGGEIKWAVTPNLILDATLNTDFAQADVDQPVNNLTRFSVLFPERRQFFLENASLFGAGISGGEGSMSGNISMIPFFSRRIGLDGENRPIPLGYGGRAVYRSNRRNFGAMYLQQQGLVNTSNQHYMVARFSENIGKYSRIGAIYTHSLNISYTAATDFLFRINSEHAIDGMFAYSDNQSNNATGWSSYIQYRYITNKMRSWFTSTIIGNNFDPVLGFISRSNVFANVVGTELNIRGEWLPLKKTIRDYVPTIQGELYQEASSGKTLEYRVELIPLSFNFINGGKLSASYIHNYQHIFSTFSPLGVPIVYGQYTFGRPLFTIASDASKKFSYQIAYETGKYFNGKLNTLDATVNLSPTPFSMLTVNVNQNRLKNLGQYSISKKVSLYNISSRFALNPQLQLSLQYQRNTLDYSSLYNIRFSWEYKPLSFIYLVFNSRESNLQERQLEQNALLKVNLLKQF
ncbi:carbohydrate binding family 9 domain-containing protein [Olivibacter sp. SDN3]|uniref:carbohydrate binding family 9 domain-containing protein n=1 Tax=Olivibacter sp. SDN3 TaxID=2764720 RepID=UPI001650E3A3|nr:carbohydrate binding family 9 domain-containing protein [Olivibacter sp. SDN3]QNL49060.1 carbohydrate binding family 9 domain-containing protein [Olivibacter sp. SDN3]